jgi:hypothetical protein
LGLLDEGLSSSPAQPPARQRGLLDDVTDGIVALSDVNVGQVMKDLEDALELALKGAAPPPPHHPPVGGAPRQPPPPPPPAAPLPLPTPVRPLPSDTLAKVRWAILIIVRVRAAPGQAPASARRQLRDALLAIGEADDLLPPGSLPAHLETIAAWADGQLRALEALEKAAAAAPPAQAEPAPAAAPAARDFVDSVIGDVIKGVADIAGELGITDDAQQRKAGAEAAEAKRAAEAGSKRKADAKAAKAARKAEAAAHAQAAASAQTKPAPAAPPRRSSWWAAAGPGAAVPPATGCTGPGPGGGRAPH